jgi:hypothetical protein
MYAFQSIGIAYSVAAVLLAAGVARVRWARRSYVETQRVVRSADAEIARRRATDPAYAQRMAAVAAVVGKVLVRAQRRTQAGRQVRCAGPRVPHAAMPAACKWGHEGSRGLCRGCAPGCGCGRGRPGGLASLASLAALAGLGGARLCRVR